MDGTPRVSVLMPLFAPNERHLREAIESVFAQTLGEWELVLVEDPPASIARAVAESYGDSRIRHHLREARSSLADALNEGLAICRAPLVARFDGDDICERERLEAQAAFLDAHPDIVAVGSSLAVIDDDGRIIGHRRLPNASADVARALRRFNCVAHPAVTFRREAIVAAGGYPSGWTPEDYDLWCRLVAKGERIENLPGYLVRYRYHPAASKFSGVHDVIRRTIATKLRHFRGKLTLGDRMRIAAERALLLLPPRLILWLFRRVTY